MTRDDLMTYLREQAAQPFAWGKNDCVQFAARLIERVRGTPLTIPYYSTETEAKRVLVELGGLEAAVSAVLGPSQSDLRLCGDGDIVLSAFHGERLLGIAEASRHRFWVRRVDAGLWPIDLTLAIRYWSCLGS